MHLFIYLLVVTHELVLNGQRNKKVTKIKEYRLLVLRRERKKQNKRLCMSLSGVKIVPGR